MSMFADPSNGGGVVYRRSASNKNRNIATGRMGGGFDGEATGEGAWIGWYARAGPGRGCWTLPWWMWRV